MVDPALPSPRPRRAHRGAAAALVAVLLAAGCGSDARAGDDGRLRVVTTVAPITSIVSAVGGDRVAIEGLVPEGADSHTFEPPPRAAEVLAGADVVFANGLHLEDSTRDLIHDGSADAELVELGDATLSPRDYIYDDAFPREGGRPNPHLWTAPLLADRYAAVVEDTLGRLDPDGAALYARNRAALSERIRQLDTALRLATSTIPPDQRVLLTYHDAYAYFAEEYGWQVVGAVQPRDLGEPSPREVADLIAQVRATGVPAIFGSEVFPSPVLEQIGREAGVRYVDVLRDDDLPGRPGDGEHSWLAMVRLDYVTMVEALGGDAAALRAVPVEPTAPDLAEYPQ
ncbi:MAG TPA: metal ABC transporter substrate-binding protein [Acidimicrobiales bacterium]|nr:metal ABC transporter substrate-binding protein [Acidimicrobiales bacterium]